MFKRRKLGESNRRKIDVDEPHKQPEPAQQDSKPDSPQDSSFEPKANPREPTSPKVHENPAEPKPRKNVTIITDFEPNICKDYARNGYCGFGDTCKFLHIRDLHPNQVKAPKENKVKEIIATDCTICKKPFTEPVVTKCGHRFCLECFLNYCKQSTKCAQCGAETNSAATVVTES